MAISLSGSAGVDSSGKIITDETVYAVGNITTESYFIGNGAYLTGITGGGNANVDLTAVTTDIIPAVNIAYSLGNASNQWKDLWVSNATIYLNSVPLTMIDTGGTAQLAFNGSPVVVASDTLPAYGANISTTAALNGGTVRTTGNITTLGNFIGNGALLTGVTANYGNANVEAYLPLSNTIIAIRANAISTDANVAVLTSQLANTDANVAALQANSFTNVNAIDLLASGNITGNITTTGNSYANNFIGNVTGTILTPLQPYITQVGTLTSLAVTNGISANSIIAPGNSVFGNVLITGSVSFPGNIDVITGNQGQFYGDVHGFGALYAGVPAGYVTLPATVYQMTAEYNDYAEMNFQNINPGPLATGDYVITADNGTNSTYYVDLGIASSTFDGTSANSIGNAIASNDSYLYAVGDTGLPAGGNLLIAAATPGKKVSIAAGGGSTNDIIATVSAADGLSVQGNITSSGNFIGNGALLTGLNVAVSVTKIVNGNSNVSIATTNGNIAMNINGNRVGLITPISIAIGKDAGTTLQAANSIAIGSGAGQSTQGTNSVAVGPAAGSDTQGNRNVAIGIVAGGISQADGAVAVGSDAGYNTQGSDAVAIGKQAGQSAQGQEAIAIGSEAGESNQGGTAIAIGFGAGLTSQALGAIGIGYGAGSNNQSNYGVSVGYLAGANAQGNNAVAIGTGAANDSQTAGAIAIGYGAGETIQGENSIAIGIGSGSVQQLRNAVAVGIGAGLSAQGDSGVAIGYETAVVSQGNSAIAIGSSAAYDTQGANAIAIGTNAGYTGQGINAIAIGGLAGNASQVANSIAINASGYALNPINEGLYISPIRNDVGNVSQSVYYNVSTSELTFAPAATGGGAVASFAKYYRSTLQTGVVANTTIIFNTSEASEGSDITVNTTTGNVTLQAGKTYRLRGLINSSQSDAGANKSAPLTQWFNATTGQWVGQSGGGIAVAAGYFNSVPLSAAEYVFTPTVTTTMQFRVRFCNGQTLQVGPTPANLNQENGGFPWMDIQVIGGAAPVTTSVNVNGPALVNIVDNQTFGTGPTTALTYDLPSAGTWELYGQITIKQSANNLWEYMALYDNTGAIVPGTTTLLAYSNSVGIVATGARTFKVTTTGPTIYTLRAWTIAGSCLFQNGPATSTGGGYTNGYYAMVGSAPISGAFLAGPWSTPTAITIGTTGSTAPTKPSSLTFDAVSYRQVGVKQYEISYQFGTNGAGINGNGDYLLALPAGLQLDVTAPNQALYAAAPQRAAYYATGSGFGLADNYQVTYLLVPYNPSSFRLYAGLQGLATNWWGSTYAGMANNTGFSLKVTVTVV